MTQSESPDQQDTNPDPVNQQDSKNSSKTHQAFKPKLFRTTSHHFLIALTILAGAGILTYLTYISHAETNMVTDATVDHTIVKVKNKPIIPVELFVPDANSLQSAIDQMHVNMLVGPFGDSQKLQYSIGKSYVLQYYGPDGKLVNANPVPGNSPLGAYLPDEWDARGKAKDLPNLGLTTELERLNFTRNVDNQGSNASEYQAMAKHSNFLSADAYQFADACGTPSAKQDMRVIYNVATSLHQLAVTAGTPNSATAMITETGPINRDSCGDNPITAQQAVAEVDVGIAANDTAVSFFTWCQHAKGSNQWDSYCVAPATAGALGKKVLQLQNMSSIILAPVVSSIKSGRTSTIEYGAHKLNGKIYLYMVNTSPMPVDYVHKFSAPEIAGVKTAKNYDTGKAITFDKDGSMRLTFQPYQQITVEMPAAK